MRAENRFEAGWVSARCRWVIGNLAHRFPRSAFGALDLDARLASARIEPPAVMEYFARGEHHARDSDRLVQGHGKPVFLGVLAVKGDDEGAWIAIDDGAVDITFTGPAFLAIRQNGR